MARLFGRRERPAPSPTPVAVDPELERRRAQAEEIANRRPGRPEAGTDKRTVRVNLSINAEERIQWEARALVAGTTLSRWAREKVNEAIGREGEENLGRGGLVDEVSAVRGELRRIGSNLNQIARGFNAESQGGPMVDREHTTRQLEAMRAAHDEMRTQLRRIEAGA